MANATAGKSWLLDTAGIIVDTPVYVKTVSVTWKVGSAGVLDLATFSREDGSGQTFVYGSTLAATSAAAHQMTQIFPVEQWLPGINLVTITDVAKCIVNVS